MTQSSQLEEYAKNIAKLTCDIEKVCRAKEVLFCESINLTPVEFRCLRYLLQNDFTQVKDLASNMDLTPSRITSLLNSLEKKHYVIRQISPDDRRIIKVTLTDIGKSFAKEVQAKYITFHQEILSTMDDKTKLEGMLASLNTFKQTLETFLNK